MVLRRVAKQGAVGRTLEKSGRESAESGEPDDLGKPMNLPGCSFRTFSTEKVVGPTSLVVGGLWEIITY